MTRFPAPALFALLVFGSTAGSTAGAGSVAAADRPNILFIYTDDHSHRTVGCYPEAYDWVRTPNIDRLATNGVRFSHAYIGTWCMPSRAMLLTGHHPYGVESMRMVGQYPGSEYEPAKCPFWPSVFRKNGYVTAHVGKWHTGTDTGAGRDWDYQKVWNRPRYQENAGAYYYDQLIETNGGKPERVPGYSTDNYTNWACDFIRGDHRDAKKPWYLWVCYGAVHGPFTPAKRHLDEYPDATVPVPKDIYPPRPGKPDYMQKLAFWVEGKDGQPIMKGGAFGGRTVEGKRGLHGNTLNDWVRQYHQGVLAIDEGVGKLIATLKESGQYDNTLIVFTSDQGFGWGQHGFCTKLAPYDATIRSPMIVSMPAKIAKNQVCSSPVSGVDIVPTFFRFAGIDLPWKVHGHDLTKLLKNPSADWNHPVLTTLTGRKYGSDTDRPPINDEDLYLNGVPWWVSLVDGQYKYIRTLVKDQVEELYDLKNDPEELTNLATQAKHAGLVARLRQATIEELKRTDAGMVDHLPPVKILHPGSARIERRDGRSQLAGGSRLAGGRSQFVAVNAPESRDAASAYLGNAQQGDPQLKSIGRISFGPDGLLLVAEPRSGSVVAIATDDTGPFQKPTAAIKDIGAVIAESMGAKAGGVSIVDMAVNPNSGNVYLAVTRTADRQIAILTVDAAGSIGVLDWDGVTYSRVTLPGKNVRNITDVEFAGNRVLAAGQSAEEFASKIYSIPVPLVHESTANVYSAETYHVAHRRWETRAPIQSFVPYEEDGASYVVGAFSCTPIAKFPLNDLKSGAKVKGISVVELGSGNRPLDMFTYERDGKRWLVANTFRFHWKKNMFGPSKWWGVRVDLGYLQAEKTNEAAARRDVKQKAGPDGIEIVDELFGAVEVAKVNDTTMAVLRDDNGKLNLEIAALP